MSFPRYPEYKDSGVEWLGEIPAHWEVVRSRHLFGLRKELARESDRPLTASQDHGVVFQEEFAELEGRRVVQAIKALDILKHVEPDDFVISMRSFQGGIERSRKRGCISSAYVILVPEQHVCNQFFAHAFKSSSYIQALQVTSNLVRDGQALRYSNFTQVDLPEVPAEEQSAIASFLDQETAGIDALVAEQERLVELLNEKRQATISHAVTKGLNPAAPMKDSGVDWLGEVPIHWNILRFSRCVQISEGQVDPGDSRFSSTTLIAPNHVESGTGRLLALETSSDQGAESGKYLCRKGDVVYSKIRPALRKVCIAPEDCLCSADMYPLRATAGLTNAFLLWALLSDQFSSLAIMESQRVAMPKINRESLGAIAMLVPPRDEQENIAAYLAHESMKCDALIAEAERAIELLQERRAALISAAVTGKIDVRPAAQRTTR